MPRACTVVKGKRWWNSATLRPFTSICRRFLGLETHIVVVVVDLDVEVELLALVKGVVYADLRSPLAV